MMDTCMAGEGADRCSADRGYALLRGGQLHRFSFSKSLLAHMAARVPDTQVVPAKIRTGRTLGPGEPSRTGLYAVCKRSGWPLRVTLFQQLADHWRHESREVRECWLNAEGP